MRKLKNNAHLLITCFIMIFLLTRIDMEKFSPQPPISASMGIEINKIENKQIRSEFKSVLFSFKKDSSSFYHEKINSVVFQNINVGKGLAICLPSENIILLTPRFYLMRDYSQKAILFHELGHCVFDYAHRDSGLMSYLAIDDKVYFYKYLKEFFDPENGYAKNNNLTIFKNPLLQEIADEYSLILNNYLLGRDIPISLFIDTLIALLKTQLMILLYLFINLLLVFKYFKRLLKQEKTK